ncbi:hypothetical protein TNCV_3548691 [Trichonephila clavipes]|nr:hypothetical protein TNCV_3548691 [Trichonephila clavipes]
MQLAAERERLSLTTRNRRRNSTMLALKKKYADQTLLAVLRQVPREADPQYVVTDPRRHIADPVSRQAVGEREKLRRATFQGDESRSFFRVHTGYFSNIPKCIKAEFIASWAGSQSSVVSSSKR